MCVGATAAIRPDDYVVATYREHGHAYAKGVAARPILGWGYGTFESAFPTVQSADIDLHYDHAHNDWLEWAIEGGLLAIAGGLALLVLALRPALDSPLASASCACVGIRLTLAASRKT